MSDVAVSLVLYPNKRLDLYDIALSLFIGAWKCFETDWNTT